MDWIAAVLTLISLELTRRRYWQGFALGAFNQILWINIGLRTGLYGLVAMAMVLMGQFVFSAYNWWREEKQCQSLNTSVQTVAE